MTGDEGGRGEQKWRGKTGDKGTKGAPKKTEPRAPLGMITNNKKTKHKGEPRHVDVEDEDACVEGDDCRLFGRP